MDPARSGFDDIIEVPTSGRASLPALRRALGGLEEPAVDEPAADPAPARIERTAPPERQPAGDRHHDHGVPRDAAPAPRETSPSADSPETTIGPAQDGPVLAALLRGESIVAAACAEIAARTGWKDVALVSDGGRDGAEVSCGGERFGDLVARGSDATRRAAWARWLGAWLLLEERQARLRELAYADDLTGAGNRRAFDEFMVEAMERSRSTRRPLVVMAFDIDDFKRYNDRYGHAAGDDVLCETVRLLRSVTRRGDRVFRIGGDEFVVVFADPGGPRTPASTPLQSVEEIASRFQKQVCDLRFPKLGHDAPGFLSISAGLASFPWDGHDAASVLAAADRRALESKRRGKNALTFGPRSERDPALPD